MTILFSENHLNLISREFLVYGVDLIISKLLELLWPSAWSSSRVKEMFILTNFKLISAGIILGGTEKGCGIGLINILMERKFKRMMEA